MKIKILLAVLGFLPLFIPQILIPALLATPFESFFHPAYPAHFRFDKFIDGDFAIFLIGHLIEGIIILLLLRLFKIIPNFSFAEIKFFIIPFVVFSIYMSWTIAKTEIGF